MVTSVLLLTHTSVLFCFNATSIKYWKARTFVRSSHPKVFCKKDVLRNFPKFTGKHLYQSLFLNKLQLYLKKDSGTGVFLWILRNFEEHLSLQNTSGGCFWLVWYKLILHWPNLFFAPIKVHSSRTILTSDVCVHRQRRLSV